MRAPLRPPRLDTDPPLALDIMDARAYSEAVTSHHAAFDEFDVLHARWQNATTQGAYDSLLIDDATDLAERLIDATDATGQGREYRLIAALAHVGEVHEFSNTPEDDLIDATDELVAAMNALVNG